MDIHEAVRNLRTRLDLSQQAFATKLGISIRAVANYEKDRIPTGSVLVKMKRLAHQNSIEDIEQLLNKMLGSTVGGEKNYELLRRVYDYLFDARTNIQDVIDKVEGESRDTLQSVEWDLGSAIDTLREVHPGVDYSEGG
ncbi:MAG: helix-turn-helix transcriptional regulator [Bryobacterales bacterium]|nr:helix-turn-helix transcriptional regulator [Bryobacterales bacterium]